MESFREQDAPKQGAPSTSGQSQLYIFGDDPSNREHFVIFAYLRELQRQADFALRAVNDVLSCGVAARQPDDFDTWYAAQSLLTALGIIRHLLLGEYIRGLPGSSSEQKKEARRRGQERGSVLRELLDLPLNTVLLSPEVRNAFEHIDERLDEATKEPYMLDTAIYLRPERMVYYREESHQNEIVPLRQLSLNSGHLHFGADVLDIYAVRHDLRLLKKRIIRACQIPRTPSNTAAGVFGAVRLSVRIDDSGHEVEGDPYPEDPDVDG